MYIVFFKYDGDVFYFGVTTGGQLTQASKSRDEVARELRSLQDAEWVEIGQPRGEVSLADIPHKQAHVRKSCRFLDGKWTIVDEVDGAISIFVEIDPVAYFVLMKDDSTHVHPASSSDEANDIANYLNEGRKFR